MEEKDFNEIISAIGKLKGGGPASVETMNFEVELLKLKMMFHMVNGLRSIAVEIEDLKNTYERNQ